MKRSMSEFKNNKYNEPMEYNRNDVEFADALKVVNIKKEKNEFLKNNNIKKTVVNKNSKKSVNINVKK